MGLFHFDSPKNASEEQRLMNLNLYNPGKNQINTRIYISRRYGVFTFEDFSSICLTYRYQ